ncbi:hypothetical protein N411_07485 [Helicobacter pylori FD535]|uniref:Uncharacterized protein n=1 Tax=Helicobacter pylori UM114 TaxID=1355531 RepID=T0F364_HELPX|nr:hypothetical protein N207_07655 [Helicobacter pylori UM114]EQL56718.1 hypothetical protein N411_07485 [Helicobacter pylori FD535]
MGVLKAVFLGYGGFSFGVCRGKMISKYPLSP